MEGAYPRVANTYPFFLNFIFFNYFYMPSTATRVIQSSFSDILCILIFKSLCIITRYLSSLDIAIDKISPKRSRFKIFNLSSYYRSSIFTFLSFPAEIIFFPSFVNNKQLIILEW